MPHSGQKCADLGVPGLRGAGFSPGEGAWPFLPLGPPSKITRRTESTLKTMFKASWPGPYSLREVGCKLRIVLCLVCTNIVRTGILI